MKKVLLFFVVAVLATLSSCDPESNSWQWKIKNTTDQTLKLKYFSYMPHVPAYVTAVIPPGESILLYKAGREKVSFNHYFEECANLYGENVYWQILSDDDIVLKTWHYSDNGLPDQRFFEESSWTYDYQPGQAPRVLIEYSWTFDILPEDIQYTEQ